MSVLAVTHLTKSYRSGNETVAVLRGVNLNVAAGESVALSGESGSGKSTLLHLIAGLDAADGGEITLSDVALSEPLDFGARGIAARPAGAGVPAVQPDPQSFRRRQSQFPVAHRRPPRCQWHAELVERLGLGDLTRRYPEQLSGGQQQRVAIGRALAPRPLLLLADEPTGNLDEETADEVLALARDLVTRTAAVF